MNIFCYGCFDLLHTGHLAFLTQAKKCTGRGAKLFVGVLPDDYIATTKGKNRPIITQSERLALIKALKCVSNAQILQKTKIKLPQLKGKERGGAQMILDALTKHKIDVLFLPQNYKISPQFFALMKELKIQIKIAAFTNSDFNISTTKIVEKITSLNK